MEAGDPSASVELELLIRTLLSVGATRKDIAEAIATRVKFSSSTLVLENSGFES